MATMAALSDQPIAPSPLAARPDLVGPGALAQLQAALLRGEPNGRLLLMLDRAETWLDGPEEAALADARDVDPGLAGKAPVLLQAESMRDMGLALGEDWVQRAIAFDARAHTPDEMRALTRYQRAGALRTALGAAADPPALLAAPALRAAMDRLYATQTEAQRHTVPGDASAEALGQLDAVMAKYRTLRAETPCDEPAHAYLCYFAAASALARGRALSGELRRARESGGGVPGRNRRRVAAAGLAVLPWTGWLPSAPVALVIAAAWQATPMNRRALLRCNRTGPLQAFGCRADRDCLVIGLSTGLGCVTSCWAMMLAGHPPWAMLCVQAVALHERGPGTSRARSITALALCAGFSAA